MFKIFGKSTQYLKVLFGTGPQDLKIETMPAFGKIFSREEIFSAIIHWNQTKY